MTKSRPILCKNYKTSLSSFLKVFAGKNPGGGTVENIYQTKKKLARTPNLLELQMNRNDYVTNIKHYKANEKEKNMQ